MKEHTEQFVRLGSTEIAGLWTMYFQESMTVCFLHHFLQHLEDEQILSLLKKSHVISQDRLHTMRQFFNSEHFPIPVAYSVDNDVNTTAPKLFHDPFALTFVYMMNRLAIINLSFIVTSNVRLDVLNFFKECMKSSNDMLTQAVALLLEKGLYDRPPKMNYPDQIEFIEKESFLNGITGHKRPLSAIELSEIFFNIERNYFGVLTMLAFLQVVKDKELKHYFLRGKKISESQTRLFNNLLEKEDLLGTVPTTMEVTESTTAPFSDKLMMSVVNLLNSIDITLVGRAVSLSLRTDLAAHYSKILAELLLYTKDGFDLMVARKWLEQPPLTTDRSSLIGI